MASKLSDFVATLRGEDLEDFEEFEERTPKRPKKKTPKKKPEPKQKQKTAPAPAREPMSSQEALLKAYKYAASKEVNEDLATALEGKPISESLRRLLEVLVDNDDFRKMLLTQHEVKKPEPKPEEYDLDPVYTDKNGEVVADEIIEAMIKAGTALETLGVTAELYRKSKKDGSDMGLASDIEFADYFNELYKKSEK